MNGFHPLLGRRHFLATAAIGTISAFLPISAAHASTTPPSPPGAETLAPTPSAPVAPASVPAGEASIIGTAASFAPADDPSIRPFHYHATDAELADLKRRIKATRWPSRELVADDTQGVQLATMQKLADYWANHHDWRKVEARINSYPNFVTNIDGLDIHFIHVKSKHPNALPIIVTHGWPGSIVEQLKIIDPLTDPTAHGGKSEDAFDVVIPSLPGYGFSGKPTDLGWEPTRIARAWTTLMDRLGYKQFVASGGDWGDPVTEQLAVNHSDRVRGDPPQHAVGGAGGYFRGDQRRTDAAKPVARRKTGARPAQILLRQGTRLRPGNDPSAANALRAGGFARPGLPRGSSITTR